MERITRKIKRLFQKYLTNMKIKNNWLKTGLEVMFIFIGHQKQVDLVIRKKASKQF